MATITCRIAKAYSGLPTRRSRSSITGIRRNTDGEIGPVRLAETRDVRKFAFEGIQPSPAAQSGSPCAFPRYLDGLGADKPVAEADTLEQVKGPAAFCMAAKRPAAH